MHGVASSGKEILLFSCSEQNKINKNYTLYVSRNVSNLFQGQHDDLSIALLHKCN